MIMLTFAAGKDNIQMKIRALLTICAVWLLCMEAAADFTVKATYTDKDGTEVIQDGDFEAELPLHIVFTPDLEEYDSEASFVWHITNATAGISITRYEAELTYDITASGVTVVSVDMVIDDQTVESGTIKITVSDSVLEMPNAFSPNNDGINDTYQAKSTYKNIIEFHAYIFNRYGQKLYDWTNWTDKEAGWDGTYNGHPVKDGVYYVYVKARGADGRDYNIKRDVNLIRNYNTTENSND